MLDLLFKPNWGAALQHLKVEVGGDAQISCGSEASHWRTGEREPSFDRGYEFWLMKQAKARNPGIQLQALVYAWPSWIGNATAAVPELPAGAKGGGVRRTRIVYGQSWAQAVRASSWRQRRPWQWQLSYVKRSLVHW